MLSLLIQFLRLASEDPRIGTAHIAIYVGLFELWCANEGKDPISFSKETVMRAARIQGKSTFYLCMRALHDYGYIHYIPSHHPVLESLVWMLIPEINNRSEGCG
jgi:hypothetical protein